VFFCQPFRHCNGAVIARTSQPEVGWLFWRSKEDEKMIQAIITACNHTSTDSAPRKYFISWKKKFFFLYMFR